VQLRPLAQHRDERGVVAEVFRAEWPTGVHPVQWNLIKSEQGVMRGVHLHPRHDDYLIFLNGHVLVGLCDLRQGSPTERTSALVELRGEDLIALVIPHGVAHGLYFEEPSTLVLGVSEYFDRTDELGCHWADPALAIARTVSLSRRDAELPSLDGLLRSLGQVRARAQTSA
jgi:dTDP-4-dehydrorhamnose 3,5-epimerase